MTVTTVGYVVVGVLLTAVLLDDVARPYFEKRAKKPRRYVVSGRTVKKKSKLRRR